MVVRVRGILKLSIFFYHLLREIQLSSLFPSTFTFSFIFPFRFINNVWKQALIEALKRYQATTDKYTQSGEEVEKTQFDGLVLEQRIEERALKTVVINVVEIQMTGDKHGELLAIVFGEALKRVEGEKDQEEWKNLEKEHEKEEQKEEEKLEKEKEEKKKNEKEGKRTKEEVRKKVQDEDLREESTSSRVV